MSQGKISFVEFHICYAKHDGLVDSDIIKQLPTKTPSLRNRPTPAELPSPQPETCE